MSRPAAIFPKLLISALCWFAMFLQQVEACSPGALRRAPAVSQIKGAERWACDPPDSGFPPGVLVFIFTTSASYDPVKGDLTGLSSTRTGSSLQQKAYEWDDMGNLISRTDSIAQRLETFGYDHLNRLSSSNVVSLPGATITTVPPPQTYTYDAKGNLLGKGSSATLAYANPGRPHAVTSATVKGFSRSYAYDGAGYVTSDGKRSYQWTSFGQLGQLVYEAAPELRDFTGGLVHPAGRVQCDFDFDAGGNRARQTKERTAANDSREIEYTLYLDSYEREIHTTKADGGAGEILAKTVHRHSLGGGIIYTRTIGGPAPGVKLTNVLKDHLGSTDCLLTGTWDGSAFTGQTTEYQSFDAWGERRDAATHVSHRTADSDPFRTGAQDYDRGYTGHEQLDDSGLIHMNGRIYDPELGRFLSPDPYVQIPEYSQNFNRYSYVLNNPLNATDPSGFSFLSKVFGKIGNWIKENWRTIVVIIVVAVITWGVGAAFIGAAGTTGTTFATAATATAEASLTAAGMAATGAIAGAVGGGLSAALAGGDLGDVLRGAVIGGIQGGISGGILHGLADGIGYDNAFLHIAGHGVVGGGANEAMGGKFQDGFLSAAAGAASTHVPFANGSRLSRTVKAAVAGGTANVLGGGKFANGAFTAAFQHLLNSELAWLPELVVNATTGESYQVFGDGTGGPGNAANANAGGSISDVTSSLSLLSMVPGPVGVVAGVFESWIYLAQGNWSGAAWAITGAAAAVVGAGAAVKGIKYAENVSKWSKYPTQIRKSGAIHHLVSPTKLIVRENHFAQDIGKVFSRYNGRLNAFSSNYWRHVLPHRHIYELSQPLNFLNTNWRRAFQKNGANKSTLGIWE